MKVTVALVLAAAVAVCVFARASAEKESCEGVFKAQFDDMQKQYKSVDGKLDLLMAKLDAFCAKTVTFQVTPRSGTYEEVRSMCRSLGGDLMYSPMKPGGIKYQRQVRELMMSQRRSSYYFVGMTDLADEGTWMLSDGTVFDGEDDSHVGRWTSGEPNNWQWGSYCRSQNCDEDCVKMNAAGQMNDFPCGRTHERLPYGICEIATGGC